MRISRERIERAFREARWREFAVEVRRGWFWPTTLAIVLGLAFIWSGAGRRSAGFEVGEAVGGRLLETETGSYPFTDVRLADGRVVAIRTPRGAAVAPGDHVRVERFEYWWPWRRDSYRYAWPKENANADAAMSTR